MKFYNNGFTKYQAQCVLVLILSLCANIVFSQGTNTVTGTILLPVLEEVEENDLKETGTELTELGVVQSTITNKIELSSQTRMAIAALADGMLPIAKKNASKGLLECDDFSTIDAELLFHVVMYVNQVDSLGAERCIELLDSKERFGELWGASTPSSMPEEFRQVAQFWKACCLTDTNRRSEAIVILRKLVDENQFKHPFLHVEALRRLCYELVLVGRLEEAAVYYATKNLPPTSDLLCGESVVFFKLGYAQVLYQLNKPVEAEAVLKQLIEEPLANPSLKATALLSNMELLLVGGQASSAVELFEKNKNEENFKTITPRIRALLFCKYAQALALSPGASAEKKEMAITDAIKAVDGVYSSEEQMFCMETLIHVLAITKHFDDVKLRLTKLLEYAPNSLYVARILRQIARGYQEAGNYEQAYWAYQLYLHSYSQSPYEYDTMIDSGNCLVMLGRLEEAALQFNRASDFAIDPGKKNLANFKAGEAYYKSGRYMQAANCFVELIPEIEAQSDILISGQLYYAQSLEKFDLPSAKIIYKQLTTSDVVEIKEPALIAIAALCVNDGELEQAYDFYNQLISLSNETKRSSYSLGLLGRGLVDLKKKNYEAALATFNEAELVPNGGEASVRATFLKTEAYSSLNQDDKAYTNIVKFLENYPESPLVMDANFWLAKHDFNLHKYEQAEQRFLDFCNTWKDSPQGPIAYLLAIHAMMKQEKYEDVIIHSVSWVDTYDEGDLLADVQYISGEARSKMMQFDLAAHSYAQAAKNANSNELKLRAMIRQADCLYTLGTNNPGRYDEAVLIYNDLIKMLDQNSNIVDKIHVAYKLAKCYEKQGKVTEAMKNYYDVIILPVEDWMRVSAKSDVDSFTAKGGSIWHARAIIDMATLCEKQGTEESLVKAERLLQRLVGTQLPCADEAEMSLERINFKLNRIRTSKQQK